MIIEDKPFNNSSILSQKQGTWPKFRKLQKKWIIKKGYFTEKKAKLKDKSTSVSTQISTCSKSLRQRKWGQMSSLIRI